MPRGKGQAKSRLRDAEVSNYWSEMIRLAKEEKKDYTAAAMMVSDYLGPDHSRLFDDEMLKTTFMDFKGSGAVTVPKIAQMRNTLGPRLYQTKPVRTITPRTDDGVMMALAKVLSEYLNYTVRETNFKKQLRKSIDDSLIRGRGILVQDFEPIREVVTSHYVSSMDFVFDPDFDDVEEAKWVAFRKCEPLWETKRRVPEKWRLKDLEPKKTSTGTHAELDETGKKAKQAYSSEQVEYWVVLSKMGSGFRGMEKASRRDDSKDFVRLEIVLDHHAPISEGPWDVPFYLDKDWPISVLDMIDPLDEQWPHSIAGQVLGQQEAIDLLSSLRLSSCKNRDRVVVFGDKSIMGKAELMQFRHGTQADFIGLDLPPGRTLADAIVIADFGTGSSESVLEREFHTQQIEQTTGVTDVVHGGQEPGAKERSATASSIRADAANVRINDLRDRVETFHSDAARKEAMIARLLLDAEDVSPIVSTSQIGMYWVHIQVPGGGHVPLRDTRTEEERQAGPPPVVTMEQVSPGASDFFASPEEAFMAAQAAFQEMLETEDPQVIDLTLSVNPQLLDPMTGLPQRIFVDVVTVDLVWEATAGITPEELMREFSYELATGSGHQLNKEAAQENADYLVQTVMPTAMTVFQATGDPGVLNNILKIRDEAFDVPQSQRVTFQPLPPPAPPEGEGEEKPPSDA